MENKAPFKTLLGHALVRDEHGDEMHKSTGNAIWFDDAAEKMGVDVMRWIYCGQNPTNNLNFGYGVGDLVRRRVFSTWWNVYSFFVNYARLDGFDPKGEAVAYEQLQDIDKWLLSKMQVLIKKANESLADFNVMEMVQCADDFVERLSNWYVRRNRRRYWRPKNASDVDKLAAYQTLYRVLVDLCKVLSPVVPFVTEDMYQNLVRSFDSDAPESVHHCDYPQVDESLYNEELAEDMDLVADVVSRVLSIRETNQIRVRQPLQRLIAVADNHQAETLKRFEGHILDELNIKQLEFVGSIDDYVSYKIKPNHKSLGPKYGRDIKTISQLLGEASANDIARKAANGEQIVLQDGANSWELQSDDVVVESSYAENIVVNDGTAPILVVDIAITDELRREGLARDIVRHIQQRRKDIGLEIQNRIRVAYSCDDETVNAAIDEHRDYICSETLCDGIKACELGDDACEVKIGSGILMLKVEKV